MPFLFQPLPETMQFTRAAGFTACSSQMARNALQYSKAQIEEFSERSALKFRSKIKNITPAGQITIEQFQKMANELGTEFAQEIYGELVEVFTQSQKLNYSIYFNLSQEKAAEWAKSLIKFMVSELDFNLKMTMELQNGFKYELSKTAANEFTTGVMTFCVKPEMGVFRRREIINPRKRKHEFTQRQEA